MDSPILNTLFSKIILDNKSEKAIYLQLADSIQEYILNGKIALGVQLPSSRKLADLLKINKITVIKAYQELVFQGWLVSHVGKGTYVAIYIPNFSPRALKGRRAENPSLESGFEINKKSDFEPNFSRVTSRLHLDDGIPDLRLAPLNELSRAFRVQIAGNRFYTKFGNYDLPENALPLGKTMSNYLNYTRGLKTTEQNILFTRGTITGLNLVCNGLINLGDVIVYGIPGFVRAEANFMHSGARIIQIPVDEYGLDTDKLKKICQKRKVRMVYVISHYHYPTTVTLSMERRLELLRLSEEYGFIILEDDYDFDFHYNHNPILPLASADEQGMVIYCGSFSKICSPSIRLGYLVASKNIIEHLAKIGLIIDRQGDHILEYAMSDLINNGTIQRSLRKAVKIYKNRRDYFCYLLETHLKEQVEFTVPEGGMAVWTKFDKKIDLVKLANEAIKRDLYLSDGTIHQYDNFHVNATRLGFTSSTNEELEESVILIKNLITR